jgi:hypothetical protein
LILPATSCRYFLFDVDFVNVFTKIYHQTKKTTLCVAVSTRIKKEGLQT